MAAAVTISDTMTSPPTHLYEMVKDTPKNFHEKKFYRYWPGHQEGPNTAGRVHS